MEEKIKEERIRAFAMTSVRKDESCYILLSILSGFSIANITSKIIWKT
jgi:hypothetical protein